MIFRVSLFYFIFFFLLSFSSYGQIQPPFDLGQDTTICEGDFIFIILPHNDGETYLWEDSTTGPYHLITTAGLYHVQTTHNEDVFADSVNVYVQEIHSFSLGDDTIVCTSEAIYYEVDTTGMNADLIFWKNGSTDKGIFIDQPGWYWVDITIDYCIVRDSLYVRSWYEDVNVFDGDYVFCDEDHDSIPIVIPNYEGDYLWSTGDTTQSIKVYSEGQYWVDISDSCGVIRDTFNLISLSSQELGFGFDDTMLCFGYTMDLEMPEVDVKLLWSTGEFAKSIEITEEGEYWACINWGDCSYCDTVEIGYHDVFNRDFLEDNYSLCIGQVLEIPLPLDSNIIITWADTILNSNIDTLVIDTEGEFIIRINDGHCDFNYKIEVIEILCDTNELIDVPNIFTPTGDGLNDYFHPINAEAIDEYVLKVYNRWGIVMYEGTKEDKGWDGTYEGIECPVGVYYWVFDFVFTKGTQKSSPWTGNVLLSRGPQ